MDKFALVYEFNKDSPLITYKACKELESQNYSKALEMLSTAVEKYPYHATTYFQYSLALAHTNDFEQAKVFLAKGDDLLGDKKTLEYYNTQLEKIKREADGISVTFDDTVNDILDETFLEPEDFETANDLELLDDDFSEGDTSQSSEIEQKSIVTETLAEIYASQGNYDEAIEIFEKLKELKPKLTEKFDTRILEINQIIKNKKLKKFGN